MAGSFRCWPLTETCLEDMVHSRFFRFSLLLCRSSNHAGRRGRLHAHAASYGDADAVRQAQQSVHQWVLRSVPSALL
jgi:hypothetical protein